MSYTRPLDAQENGAATQAAKEETPPFCPSAQPGLPGAFAFGVMGGTAEERRVSYLEERVPVTEELLALSGPVKPSEVFRFAAPCATSACQHFDGHDCQLAVKLVQLKVPVTVALPACTLRRDCRWWRQEGKAACMVCPSIRTEAYKVTDNERLAADPKYIPERNPVEMAREAAAAR